jgi:hypothetical protein
MLPLNNPERNGKPKASATAALPRVISNALRYGRAGGNRATLFRESGIAALPDLSRGKNGTAAKLRSGAIGIRDRVARVPVETD